ncbi:MAG: UPF0104 family protein [Archaeoglobales archaeon]|nr:UPF0104 family protein [Archaeoglobales archaeon]
MNYKAAIVGVIISVVCMLIIFETTKSEITWSAIKNANPLYVILAVIAQFFFWIFWALRIKFIVKNLGYFVSFKDSLRITISGMFAAAITPSSAGGEPVRAKMLNDFGVNTGEAAFVVLAERMLDAIFFSFALPVFAIFTGFSLKLGMQITLVFVVAILVFLGILYLILKDENSISKAAKFIENFLGRVSKRAEYWSFKFQENMCRFRSAVPRITRRKKDLSFLIFLTAVIWSIEFSIPSILLLAFSSDPYFLYSYTAQLIITIVSLLPLTPGSSGIAETSMAYLYSAFIHSGLLGITVAIWRIITYHMNLVFGLLVFNYSILLKNLKKK